MNQLEKQTQIVGLGHQLAAYEQVDSIPQMTCTGVLMVCLCDQLPSDETLFDRRYGNWRLCKTHDGAVKLESLNGANVRLFAIDKAGDISPIRVGGE